MSKKLLIFEAIMLSLVLMLIACVALFTTADAKITRPIADLIPAEVPGWRSESLKLANTEVMNEIVQSVLKFDGVAYRAYVNNKKEWVTVYVAYWKPGKVTTTDAGVHNPDSCWVNAGSTRILREHGKNITVGGKKLKPAEYGEYLAAQREEDRGKEQIVQRVLFWHLVGGETNSYEKQKTGFRSGLWGRLDRLPLVLDDIKKYGLNQRREQMFIRLVLSRPIEEFANDADFARLLETLRPLGIFEGDSWDAAAEKQKIDGVEKSTAAEKNF